MKSNKMGNNVYLRVDKGEEVLESILLTCKKYNISSATFNGLGACNKATIGTYIPEKHDFLYHTEEGRMLEMVSLIGNVTLDKKNAALEIHAHSMFSYFDSENDKINYFGGDLKSAEIMYTGEITINPVMGGQISKVFDPQVGINVWDFVQKDNN